MGRPERATELRGAGGGVSLYEALGPCKRRELLGSFPSCDRSEQHPQFKGKFYSGWVASAQNGENSSLLCDLTQVLMLVLWTMEGNDGIFLLQQGRLPGALNICSSSGGSVSPPTS